MRSAITVTPDSSAASASRLLAVRSSRRGLRHSSITATPTSAQRTTSAAARSTASGSGITPKITWAGSMPTPTSPGACRAPLCFSAWASRSHTKLPPNRCAMAATKPAAQPASSGSAANISCSRARISPPPSASSIPAWPSCTCRIGPAARAHSMPAIWCLRDSRESDRNICSYYVPFYGTSNMVLPICPITIC